MVNSGFSHTATLMTSSVPMRYSFFADNRSSFDRGKSGEGGVCSPGFIEAVSIRDAGGGGSSRVHVSSIAGGGRIAGGGNGAIAVAGGVEGSGGGGFGDGTDPSLEGSPSATGGGANAVEGTS